MLLLVLKKPGLQGGHWVFTPEAGSFTDPSRSSPQIFGMAHLYMSCVCKHEVSKSQHGWDLGHVSNQNTSKRKRSGFEKEHVSMLSDTRTERVSDLNSKPCPLAPPPAWVHHAGWWGFLQCQWLEQWPSLRTRERGAPSVLPTSPLASQAVWV